jgi:hypothetical protein
MRRLGPLLSAALLLQAGCQGRFDGQGPADGGGVAPPTGGPPSSSLALATKLVGG